MEQAVAAEILGRDEELARLGVFLDAAGDFPAALVIEGEAGIGKTTIWQALVALGRDRSYRVIGCRPGRMESDFAYAALADLLEPVLPETLPGLPPPQRRALAVALLLEEPVGAPADQRAIAAGLLGVLRLLARDGPLLVAIDDVQWLDRASAVVLEYALRRLERVSARVVVSVRSGGEEPLPLGLDGAFPEGRLERMRLGPLSSGALGRLIRERFGHALARPTLLRVHELTGGNPFYALEFVRALERARAPLAPGEPLPLPGSVHELVRERLGELRPQVRNALLVAAALREPTLERLELAAPGAGTALEDAVTHAVVDLDGRRIRFRHPLLAAAVYGAAPPERRRELHRRLAEVAEDPEERARHRALAADGPDPEAAAALEQAAARAAARGAPAIAAELCEHALLLTPASDETAPRRLRVQRAEWLMSAGDAPGARALLEGEIARTAPGPERAALRVHLAPWLLADISEAVEMLKQGLAEAAGDPRVTAQILGWLSAYEGILGGDLSRGLEHVRAAVAQAERAGDEMLLAGILARLGSVEALTGLPARSSLERAAALLGDWRPPRAADRPELFLASIDIWAGRLKEARPVLETLYEDVRERSDEYSRIQTAIYVVELEWRAGDWVKADQIADDIHTLAAETGLDFPAVERYSKALMAASRGQVALARCLAAEGVQASELGHEHLFGALNRYVLGFLEFSLDNASEAQPHFDEVDRTLERMGIGDPGAVPFWGDAVECLLQLGEHERAKEMLGRLERQAEVLEHPWRDAIAARCRGLLQGAAGEQEAALDCLVEALARFEAIGFPFERGRTLLALGVTQRRGRQKRTARESLEAALTVFDELGAPLWAERARAEWKRIGGRRSARGELSETERRVAELVAEGKSNREVAAALSMTVRTVEWNLSKVYAKLAVRSRTELAHRLALERQR
jgi:DNA-binding CsgD family transcriptional regulator